MESTVIIVVMLRPFSDVERTLIEAGDRVMAWRDPVGPRGALRYLSSKCYAWFNGSIRKSLYPGARQTKKGVISTLAEINSKQNRINRFLSNKQKCFDYFQAAEGGRRIRWWPKDLSQYVIYVLPVVRTTECSIGKISRAKVFKVLCLTQGSVWEFHYEELSDGTFPEPVVQLASVELSVIKRADSREFQVVESSSEVCNWVKLFEYVVFTSYFPRFYIFQL